MASNNCLIGTCGFDYLDWRGSFYPDTLPRKDFLSWYATHFQALEINYTYYQMPSASQLAALADRSGPALQFSVKAHESLTHRIDPQHWQEQARLFRQALAPLQERRQLAAVLLQFPSSFPYDPAQRIYLDELLSSMEGLPRVVEFRHVRWLGKRVIDGLRRRNVAFSCTDLPLLPSLPPATEIITADLAYVRFHGRNDTAFWGSDAAARFDYLYKQEELQPWVTRIRTLSSASRQTLVFFNNHRKGQAPRNALELRSLLEKAQ